MARNEHCDGMKGVAATVGKNETNDRAIRRCPGGPGRRISQ
jgi:hypothetical protein